MQELIIFTVMGPLLIVRHFLILGKQAAAVKHITLYDRIYRK